MKAIILLFAAALLAGSASFSNPSTPIIDSKIPGFTQVQDLKDTLPVPVHIRTAFISRYPNASKVTWYRYTPPTSMKPEMTDWYYSLDPSDYYVSFNWEDADYVAWYDNGTWIRSSKRIDNTELPDVVTNMISRDYPGFAITDVDLETDKGQTLYEIDLEKGNMKHVLHVNSAGAVVKHKQRTLNTSDPTTTMVSDFQTRYPTASDVVWYHYSPRENVEILPSDWDYNLDATDYEVRFMSDGTEYVAWYDNGTWVRSEAYMFDASKLPNPINAAITKEYNGYTIKDVEREDYSNQVLYEVELQKGSNKCKIHYAADGSVMKKKCKVDGVKTKTKS